MKPQFVPSIIAETQKEFEERFKKVEKVSKVFQLDVMDGKFVKNKSFMFDFQLNTRGIFRKNNFEIHLMCENPLEFITKNKMKFSKKDIFILQIESDGFKEGYDYLKKEKSKIGIGINPQTIVEKIKKFVNEVDLILIMTVNPGRYGAKFLPKTLDKVKEIRKFNSNIDIEIDGSVNEKTIFMMKKSGANKFVLGSYLQNSDDVRRGLREIDNLLNNKV